MNHFYSSGDFRLSYLWDDTAAHVNNGSPVFLARSVIQNFSLRFSKSGKNIISALCSMWMNHPWKRFRCQTTFYKNQEVNVINLISFLTQIQKNILFGNLKRMGKKNSDAITDILIWIVHWIFSIKAAINEFFHNYQQHKVDRSGNYFFPYFSYVKFVIATAKF